MLLGLTRRMHFICFITTCMVLVTACALPAQSVEISEEIVEPEPLWPDSTEFIVYEKEARPLNFSEIHRRIGYPEIPADAEISSGKVVVRILLDQYGNYVRHHLVKGGLPEVTENIEALIPDLMWLPAEKDGRPAASWVTIPFNICFKK